MAALTSITGYLTPRQYLLLVDWRLVADWAGDKSFRLSRRSLVDPTHPGGQVVAAKLMQAAGDLEAVAIAGGKYSADDLAGLTGSTQATLWGLVAGRTNWLLATRRASLADPKKVPGAAESAERFEAIRKGEAIFGISGPVDAAGMEAVDLHHPESQIGGRIVTSAHRFFGNRGSRSCH